VAEERPEQVTKQEHADALKDVSRRKEIRRNEPIYKGVDAPGECVNVNHGIDRRVKFEELPTTILQEND